MTETTPARIDFRPSRGGAARSAGAEIRLLSWNLGYAGLGAESEFIADGGRRVLPPSRRAVGRSIAAQAAFLAGESFDVALLQEAARRGPMTWWREHLGALDAALGAEADRWFLADVAMRLPPAPLGLRHGLALYCRRAAGPVAAHRLPAEDKPLFAGVRRAYALLEIALPIPGRAAGWRLFNLHFSAFDAGAALRERQLARALALAEAAFSAGEAVILGGDFNYALAETDFPHDPASAHSCLTWMRPFPEGRLAPGWRIAADPATPSVRTVDRPYRPGVNKLAVIDGFVVSPNVEIVAVEGVDLGFAPSDHQPVRGAFRAV